jgi:SAM-dependent methyltransferase
MASSSFSDPPDAAEVYGGIEERYDTYRPRPPAVLPEILTQLAQIRRPRLVVDLGSGTGLSTRAWAGHADAVVGIEPAPGMRRVAEARAAALGSAGTVRFQAGLSTQTGLPDGCADIVTCSQALHWMEPEPTFAEVSRILRPGGVFAAYDYDWGPAMHWEAERALGRFMARLQALRPAWVGQRWAKDAHLARMQASGHFRYTRELLIHSREMGGAERLVAMAATSGVAAMPLKQGLAEAAAALEELRVAAERILGEQVIPWYFSYRVRIGVK